ncbi:MAG TPA: hypothetical protein VK427_09915, partial [Kofleriaceae bacterium]|nr:hypothetical protein [Kofleriaceae bacterium]
MVATAPALRVASSRTLDTSLDTSCTSVSVQANGSELCVLHYGEITVERNQTLTVTGSRALALVADRTLTIDGTLDVSANLHENGPGGGYVKSGTAGAGNGGGGGAGYRTPGGAGASNDASGGAMNGGPAGMPPAA